MMSLRNLAIFVAVAETGGVSSAAGRLNTVQSNVTARLKDLETQVDAILFHRTAKGMVLTASGEVLLDHAREMLRLADAAHQAVRDSADGLLRLGTLETTSAVRLPAVLKRFHQAFPRAEIRLTAGTTEALIDHVVGHRLDGAFVAGPADHPDLVGEPVFHEHLVEVHPTGTPAAGPVPVIISFRQGCTYRACSERWLRERGAVPYRVMELGTLDGILGCVAAGLGSTLLPQAVIAASAYADAIEVRPVPDHIARVPTYFIRRHATPVGRALRSFLDMLD